MTKAVAEQKLYSAQKASPDWRFWLAYDVQRGWQLFGEPIINP